MLYGVLECCIVLGVSYPVILQRRDWLDRVQCHPSRVSRPVKTEDVRHSRSFTQWRTGGIGLFLEMIVALVYSEYLYVGIRLGGLSFLV